MKSANYVLLAILSLSVPFLARAADPGGDDKNGNSGEMLDNDKLMQAVSSGMSPDVVDIKIKNSQCHFDDSMDALVKVKEAAEKGQWKPADVAALQKTVIAKAGEDKKRLHALVQRALTVFCNVDQIGGGDAQQTDEYGVMMRLLMKEGKAVVPFLLPQLEQEDQRQRGGILDALSKIGDKNKEVMNRILPLLYDRSKPVRLEAARCVGVLAGATTGDDLITKLADRNAKQDGVALALGYLPDAKDKAIDPLVRTLQNALDSDTRVACAFALGQLRASTPASREALLVAVLDDRDDKLRETAARALAYVGEKRTPDYIARAFERYRNGREELLKDLAYFKSSRSVTFLLEQLESDSPKIKRVAQETLQILSGENNFNGADEWRAWWEQVRTRQDWIDPKAEAKAMDMDAHR
jgi:HEAT repeat protein